VSQFRATYTTLLNLLDAYGSFREVREIAERSFAHREAARQIAQLEKLRRTSEETIESKFKEAGCGLPVSVALGLERLVSARTRLQEAKPQTRAEVFHQWLDDVVKPGRVVGIGRSGRRLVMITEKREGNVGVYVKTVVVPVLRSEESDAFTLQSIAYRKLLSRRRLKRYTSTARNW